MATTLGLGEIAQLMRRYLEEDGAKKSLVVEGRSAEEALADAAVQLGIPVKGLEYEIVEKGNPGVLGAGRKPWRLRAYPAAVKRAVAMPRAGAEEEDFESAAATVEEKDIDGECFVRLSPDGALLKVSPPQGKGKRISE